MSDHQGRHLQVALQLLQELLARHRTQRLGEPQHAQRIEAEALDQPPALAEARQARGRRLRIQELARHGLEAQHERRAAEADRLCARGRDQGLVAEVQAVERTERRDAAAVSRLQVAQATHEPRHEWPPEERSSASRRPATNSAPK
ncbi:MAG: hypothetical protein U1F11_14570 [Steroidobacteraceae bacterium]